MRKLQLVSHLKVRSRAQRNGEATCVSPSSEETRHVNVVIFMDVRHEIYSCTEGRARHLRHDGLLLREHPLQRLVPAAAPPAAALNRLQRTIRQHITKQRESKLRSEHLGWVMYTKRQHQPESMRHKKKIQTH